MDLETARRFIEAWHAAADLAEFCARFGCDKRTASNHAAYLRRRGVDLPQMPTTKTFPARDANGRAKQGLTKDDWEKLQRFSEACATAELLKRKRQQRRTT